MPEQILPSVFRKSNEGVESPEASPAYAALIERLRDFLDQFASANIDDATAVSLDKDLRDWTDCLRTMSVEEPARMFGRIEDVPGHGQVTCPAFLVEDRDTTSVRASITFGEYFLGFNSAAHGGAIAMLFDEILAFPAISDAAKPTRTAYLKVNYRAIAPIGKELSVTARLESVEGRKRIVRGELRDGDIVCADAEGLFIELRPGQQ